MRTNGPAPAGLHAESARLPVEGDLPGLDGATGWLNSPQLTPSELRGSVVVVNFWTYTCINWLRQFPYVRAWAEKYAGRGLTVVGVHTPEFSFEHDPGNVRRAVQGMSVGYPVALDSGYAVWRAFANNYWPALYFADAQGRIRHHHFGEGEYQQSEMVIQRLLAEAGHDAGRPVVSVHGRGVEAAADWGSLRSAETYLGYQRAEGFASGGGVLPERSHPYPAPGELRLGEWALAGSWTMGEEAVALDQAGGAIFCRFHSRDLHLVMGPPARDAPVRFRVLLDGRPPGAASGADVDAQGNGIVADPRLYQLIRQPGPITDRTFEITFADPGGRAFAFTFG